MTEFVEVACYRCKEPFGLARSSYQALQRNEQRFHCPWGHAQVFSAAPSEADKLRLERDRLKQQIAQKDDETRAARELAEFEAGLRRAAERQASAARGVATRLKNRAAAGVCPCCNRTFVQLARHMATKHKSFQASEVKA